MNKNWVIASIAVVVLIIGAVAYSSNSSKLAGDSMEKDKMSGEKIMENGSMENEDKIMEDTSTGSKDTMMQKDDKMSAGTSSKETLMQKTGSYIDYSASALEAAQNSGGKVVLFFHAAWCPDCRTADTNFKAHPEQIPAGITVLKTDYDKEKDLKTKYGVTYQHTFVQIDKDGNQLAKWISGDTKLLAKNIK